MLLLNDQELQFQKLDKPDSFEIRFNIFKPSNPRPWKSYGDVRGLYAPPLISFKPFDWIAAATSATCVI